MTSTPYLYLDIFNISSQPSLSLTASRLEDNGLFVDNDRRKCRKVNMKLSGNQKRQQKKQHFAQLWPQLFVNETISPISALEYSQKLISNQMEHSSISNQIMQIAQDKMLSSSKKRSHMSIYDTEEDEKGDKENISLLFERRMVSESNWTLDEDVLICELHNQNGNDWAYIAARLQGRNRIEVKTRFRSITRAAKRHWTNEQDDLLRHLFVNQYDKLWNDEITSYFQDRTKTSVKSHLKELMEGSLINKVYPIGSPIHVLIQRPDLHQLLLNSRKITSNSKFDNKNREEEGDGSCQSAEEDDEDHTNDKQFDSLLSSQPQEMTPSSQSKITMKCFNQNLNANVMSSAYGYEHIEPVNLSYPMMKQQENGMKIAFSQNVSMVDQIVFDDVEFEILMDSLSD